MDNAELLDQGEFQVPTALHSRRYQVFAVGESACRPPGHVLFLGHSPSQRRSAVSCVTFCCLLLVLLVILAIPGCSECPNTPLIKSTGRME